MKEGASKGARGQAARLEDTDVLTFDIPTLVYSCMPVYVSSGIDEQSLSFFCVCLLLSITSPFFSHNEP